MFWRRDTDYHGSRSYGADKRGMSAFRRAIARLTGRKAAPARRAAEFPFPLNPGATEPRNWRVLP